MTTIDTTTAFSTLDVNIISQAISALRVRRADLVKDINSLPQADTLRRPSLIRELQTTTDNIRSLTSRLAALLKGQVLVPYDPENIINSRFDAQGRVKDDFRDYIQRAISNEEARKVVTQVMGRLAMHTAEMNDFISFQGEKAIRTLQRDASSRAYSTVVSVISRAAEAYNMGNEERKFSLPEETIAQAQTSPEWTDLQQSLLGSLIEAKVIQVAVPRRGGSDALLSQESQLREELRQLQGQPMTKEIVARIAKITFDLDNIRKMRVR